MGSLGHLESQGARNLSRRLDIGKKPILCESDDLHEYASRGYAAIIKGLTHLKYKLISFEALCLSMNGVREFRNVMWFQSENRLLNRKDRIC